MAADSNDEGHSAKFQNLLNFRDVGEIVNSYLGRKQVTPNEIYRSTRVDSQD
jgi:protein-tyrosine phosphatase